MVDTDRVEVTIRICISLILTYILTLGSFPNVIPQSQLVLIGSFVSAFTMILPTLMFSIGAVVFPGMVMTSVVALLLSTMLLAVAASKGGVVAYLVVYFFVALILAGLRFTNEGASSALLLMLTSLNTMSLAPVAEERGMEFVTSLWTKSGFDNPNAVFRNSLIGMLWTCLCISSARLIPPARTARCAHSRVFLPKMLRDVASLIRLTIAHHIENDVEDTHSDSDSEDGDDNGELNSTASEKPKSLDDMITSVVQDAAILTTGGIAGATALEPRLFRLFCQCSPPVDVLSLLLSLTDAVNDMMFSALTLRAFSKAGYQELQVGGLKEIYDDSCNILDQCADSLAAMKKADNSNDGDDDAESTGKLPFDPIRIYARADKVQKLTNDWIDAMGPIDRTRSHFDKTARDTYLRFLRPWLTGAGFGLIFAIFGCIAKAFDRNTWKRIMLPPYYDLPQFIWALKFATGFLCLIIMQIYWPAFRDLEIATRDEAAGAHFSGWYLIAYAFSTTQTVEGSIKKSILRAVGTAAGGFSAWLALTACNSGVGLGVWLSITNTIVAFGGLSQGFGSRFGLDKDMAWGPAYFSMTQALVVLEVYLGYGGKNDITLNRIVANLVGIGMSVVMALIPPSVYGLSPRTAKFLVEDKKRVFRDCIELVLDGSDITKLHQLHAVTKDTFISGFTEINGNFNDANQLQRLCIYKAYPRMKFGLGHMAVLGSTILSLIKFGIILIEVEPIDGERFGEGSEERRVLTTILDALDIDDDIHNISTYHLNSQAREGKDTERPTLICDSLNQSHRVVPAHTTFAHLCIFITHYIMHRERKLDAVTFGFLGNQSTEKGRRTRLPCQLLSLYDNDEGAVNSYQST